MKDENWQKKGQQEFGPEDEGWYEDVREGEKTRGRRIFNVVKALLALVVLVGLIYFSGIYQGTFFQKTSRQAQPRQLSRLVEGEILTLPLSVVSVVAKGEEGKRREEIDSFVSKASVIWDQAAIDLELVSYTEVKLGDRRMRSVIDDPKTLLSELPQESKEGVIVFLVHSLDGINGIAFVGGRTVAVAEFTTVYDFRVLAHEVGHILGLSHVREGGRLMSTDAGGAELTVEEAEKARQTLVDIFE
jgi:hypothetical protein